MNNDCLSRQENYAEKVFAWPLESISGPSLPGQRWHTQWPLGTGARVIVKCICSYCTFSTLWNVFVCWRNKWALRELVHPISNYPPTTLSRRTWDMFQRKSDLLKLRLAAWFLILRIQFKTVLVLFPSIKSKVHFSSLLNCKPAVDRKAGNVGPMLENLWWRTKVASDDG